MKIFSSLASLDQIRGSPLGTMLREIVIRMLGHASNARKEPSL